VYLRKFKRKICRTEKTNNEKSFCTLSPLVSPVSFFRRLPSDYSLLGKEKSKFFG